MQEFLAQYGLFSLFLLSFLASTLLPLGSEWLLVTMLLQKNDPVLLVAIASIGNYLGACTTYWIGMYCGPWVIRRLLRIDEATQHKAEGYYARYGSWSLLFSWLPIIGDPLCLAGGLLKIGFSRFTLFVLTGKVARYASIAWLTSMGVDHLPSLLVPS